MFHELTVGAVIMLVCAWGCGAIFYLIGRHADRSQKPIHFWSGSAIDPCRVSDVSAYNHENALMWKRYSIPYWISGILSCFGAVSKDFVIAATAVLFLACFPGLFFLIRKYRKIEKTYIH